jgi:hypothetical protein
MTFSEVKTKPRHVLAKTVDSIRDSKLDLNEIDESDSHIIMWSTVIRWFLVSINGKVPLGGRIHPCQDQLFWPW